MGEFENDLKNLRWAKGKKADQYIAEILGSGDRKRIINLVQFLKKNPIGNANAKVLRKLGGLGKPCVKVIIDWFGSLNQKDREEAILALVNAGAFESLVPNRKNDPPLPGDLIKMLGGLNSRQLTEKMSSSPVDFQKELEWIISVYGKRR